MTVIGCLACKNKFIRSIYVIICPKCGAMQCFYCSRIFVPRKDFDYPNLAELAKTEEQFVAHMDQYKARPSKAN